VSDLHIRDERAEDVGAIHRTNELAFGRPDEAELVDALRGNGAVTLSLVAEIGEEIAGHILFSPVEIVRDGDRETAVGLAPMAVLPSRQRLGIGSQLIREGIDRLRLAGHGAIVVLGHPEYYPRFGFTRASTFGLRCEFQCPDEAFMALELRQGALGSRPALVRYRPEFSAF
jgi:putative acetyltransferase